MKFFLLVLFLVSVLAGAPTGEDVGSKSKNDAQIQELLQRVEAATPFLTVPPYALKNLGREVHKVFGKNRDFHIAAENSFAPVNTIMPADPNVGIAINNIDSVLTNLQEKSMRAPFLSGSYPLDLGKSADDVKAITRLRGKIEQLSKEISAPAPAEPKSSLTEEEKNALKKLKTEINNVKYAAHNKPEPTGLKPMETLMYDMLYRRVKNVARAAKRRAPPKPQDPNKIQEDLYKELASEMRKLQQATLRRPRNTSNRDY